MTAKIAQNPLISPVGVRFFFALFCVVAYRLTLFENVISTLRVPCWIKVACEGFSNAKTETSTACPSPLLISGNYGIYPGF